MRAKLESIEHRIEIVIAHGELSRSLSQQWSASNLSQILKRDTERRNLGLHTGHGKRLYASGRRQSVSRNPFNERRADPQTQAVLCWLLSLS